MTTMATTDTFVSTQRRTTVLMITGLLIAGVAFAAYPLLRGSGSETGMAGAELYARPAWVVAHSLGMIGFVAAAWGFGAVDRIAGRLAAIGAMLVLPYYGAETFGLNAIGRLAVRTDDPSVIAAADLFRYQPAALIIFGAGLLFVAATGVRLLMLVPSATGGQRLGLLLTGLALVMYLPQFFGPFAGRITHGIVLGAGLVVLAGSLGLRDVLSRRRQG